MLLGVAVAGRLFDRDPRGHLLDFCERRNLNGFGDLRLLLCAAAFNLRDDFVYGGGNRCFLDHHRRGGRLCAVAVLERKLLMRRQAAVARAGERLVRTALAVRQHRRAAAGELLALVRSAVSCGGFRLSELGVRLDVHLPAGEARGQACVQSFLADRERKLIIWNDDGRLFGLVVDEDLAHPCGRQRLRDEPRRLGVPRDDVDLLAAELGDDHAHARAAGADARADRVDALGVRLDGDLRAVAGLPRDAADLDEAVADLRHLQLEEGLDQLRIAPRQDYLRSLRARSDLRDDGLDARALLIALAVDLLRTRQ